MSHAEADRVAAQVKHAFRRYAEREANFNRRKLNVFQKQLEAQKIARQAPSKESSSVGISEHLKSPSGSSSASPARSGAIDAGARGTPSTRAGGNWPASSLALTGSTTSSCPTFASAASVDEQQLSPVGGSRFWISHPRSCHPPMNKASNAAFGKPGGGPRRRQPPADLRLMSPLNACFAVGDRRVAPGGESLVASPARASGSRRNCNEILVLEHALKGSSSTPCVETQTPLTLAASNRFSSKASHVRIVEPTVSTVSANGAAGQDADDQLEEEDLLFEMDALNVANDRAVRDGALHSRPLHTHEMLTRLGDLMGMLGPRYKTANKELIKKRAQAGELSPFQRRLAKGRAMGSLPPNFLGDVLRKEPGADLELITPDIGSEARTSWLTSRRQQRATAITLQQELGGL